MPANQSRENRGRLAHHAGSAAEECVLRVYSERGLDLAAQRWRSAAGELDLVFRDDATVIFVEVKRSKSFAGAAASLSQRQIERLFAAASEFLGDEPAGLLTDTRFDVALVNGSGVVEIHENALMA